jgi:hypothetical protein
LKNNLRPFSDKPRVLTYMIPVNGTETSLLNFFGSVSVINTLVVLTNNLRPFSEEDRL